MYRFFRFAKTIWVGCGSPFPRAARDIRHLFFGQWWPADVFASPPGWLDFFRPLPKGYDVAAIITCHNYGKYLAEAVESLLAQKHVPSEIVIVDDASTDDTADVAARFASRNVRYIRGEWRNVSEARNRGAMETRSPFLLFLDADDSLPQHYVHRCLRVFRSPCVAIAYGNMRMFGESHRYWRTGAYSRAKLTRNNFISSHAVIRRDAFSLAGGYRDPLGRAHEDWGLWKRAVAAPWSAKRARTFVRYRIHAESALQKRTRDPKRLYRDDADVLRSLITIFSTFHEDSHLPAYLADLRSLEIPSEMIRLHLLYDGSDTGAAERIRTAMSATPYRDVLFQHHPAPKAIAKLTGDERARCDDELRDAAMLNAAAANCTTDFILVWNPGVRIGPKTLAELSLPLDPHVIGVLSKVHGSSLDLALLRGEVLKRCAASTDLSGRGLTCIEKFCDSAGKHGVFVCAFVS